MITAILQDNALPLVVLEVIVFVVKPAPHAGHQRVFCVIAKFDNPVAPRGVVGGGASEEGYLSVRKVGQVAPAPYHQFHSQSTKPDIMLTPSCLAIPLALPPTSHPTAV